VHISVYFQSKNISVVKNMQDGYNYKNNTCSNYSVKNKTVSYDL